MILTHNGLLQYVNLQWIDGQTDRRTDWRYWDKSCLNRFFFWRKFSCGFLNFFWFSYHSGEVLFFVHWHIRTHTHTRILLEDITANLYLKDNHVYALSTDITIIAQKLAKKETKVVFFSWHQKTRMNFFSKILMRH